MRPITKILLLAAVAFAVYLLWPRTANLGGFNSRELAALEVRNWQSQKNGKGLQALLTRYKVYSSQYHFDPISAFRIAQSQVGALKNIKLLKLQPDGDPAVEGRAIAALTEKYTWIKKQTKLDYDADAMAREELAWRTLELDHAAPGEVALPLSRVLAGLYGGAPEDFMDVATEIATARTYVLFDEVPENGVDALGEARAKLVEAYSLLKEIADTPPGASTAAQ